MASRLSHWLAFPQVDVVVVGAGAAGIGCAVSLTRAFGLDPARVRLLDRGDAVGASFRAWPEEMRFISPSFTVHKSNCVTRFHHGSTMTSTCIRLTG